MTARNPLLLPLLALLLATRALVPAGWMPVADAGGVHITLCTGQGQVGAILGPDGKVHEDMPGMPGHRDPCPYGTLAWAVDTPALPEIVPAPELPPEDRAAPRYQAPVAFLHAPRPLPRGPPSFA
jgi:hypothetical protein